MKCNLNSREDVVSLVMDLLNPLKPCYSAGGARLDLGATAAVYDQGAVWAEAFLRPLWGLVPLWAGGSTDTGFEELYRKGLTAGTDPQGGEYWGGFQDIDQRFVEMAAVSYAILMTPEVVWDPLTQMQRQNLVQWLDGINHYECPACNWKFFGVLVNIACKSKGMPYDAARLDDYLNFVEECYEGNGWYIDGPTGAKDYYISFAFHYYGLLYAKFMKDEDPERCAEFENRAMIFAKDFVYWFADGGAALPYGRSLTYRIAQVSFFSMCAACELEVFPLPVMKGIIMRHLEYWMELPICDRAGILTIGYAYPNLMMSEQYNAPGSPYWGMKAFAFLCLPEDHAFWKAESAPLPELDNVRTIANEAMVMQRIEGEVYAYVPGRLRPHQHVHTEEKYQKFVYSTKYGFSVSRSWKTLEEAAPDNVLAVVSDGMVYAKGVTDHWTVEGDGLVMEWSPRSGVRITTRISLLPDGHRRTHTIDSEIACEAVDCGFAVPYDSETSWRQNPEGNEVLVWNGQEGCRVCDVPQENQKSESGASMVIQASPNTSLLFARTVIPGMRYQIKKGIQTITTDFTVLRR